MHIPALTIPSAVPQRLNRPTRVRQPLDIADERDALAQVRDLVTQGSKQGQTDAPSAEEYWENVLSGRWSLVDRFDASGRRHLVAIPRATPPDPSCCLSAQERNVMRLLAEGFANKVIAFELGVSESTIGTHLNNICRKFGFRDRATVIRAAQVLRAAA